MCSYKGGPPLKSFIFYNSTGNKNYNYYLNLVILGLSINYLPIPLRININIKRLCEDPVARKYVIVY